MAGFKSAQNHGCQMIELDVQLTRDGRCVVFHDPSLQRTSLARDVRNVGEVDYDELKTIHLRHRPENMFEQSSNAVDEPATETIPLLEDVLVAFGQRMAMHIDVKTGGTKIICELDRLIRVHDLEGSVVWGSPSEPQREALMAQNANIKTFASKDGVISTYAFWYLGLLPFLRSSALGQMADYFSVVHPTPAMRNHFHQLMAGPQPGPLREAMAQSGTAILSWLLDSPMMFQLLEARGVRVLLWVVNDEEDWERTARASNRVVTGVMTDRPAEFGAWLQKKRGP
eukprot:CAMPEP_0177731796 /NCGR_PEP_ID=MMETSP0484_2-20121128/22751_1 /TAXON_ID=354590 /ORGANISM="Rhodomonas lens, Strain RHODO" /LENGTH=283 /DNA_ID=CAMNT_0019244951 /DNA_START=34 /DNA_END=886 /DNA_ORIENTATION=+